MNARRSNSLTLDACPQFVVGAPLFALALTFMSAFAVAQEATRQPPPPDEGPFGSIGRWFDEQFQKLGSGVSETGKGVQNFGREAGTAARATVDGARDAADALGRLPNATLIKGHEKCALAPNGAPDCLGAARAICKAKGFENGKSMDMTTAEICPPSILAHGRRSGEGCRDETFVSQALCQ